MGGEAVRDQLGSIKVHSASTMLYSHIDPSGQSIHYFEKPSKNLVDIF